MNAGGSVSSRHHPLPLMVVELVNAAYRSPTGCPPGGHR